MSPPDLLELPVVQALPPSARARVAADASIRNYRDTEVIFEQGTPADGVFALLTGGLRFSRALPSGDSVIIAFLDPYHWFGTISIIRNEARNLRCAAVGPTDLLFLPRATFEELLATDLPFCNEVLRWTAQMQQLTVRRYYDVMSLPLRALLAKQLIKLADAHGEPAPEGVRIGVRLSQEELAMLVGATRQRVNQLLRQWQREGVVSVDYRTITLRDIDTLRLQARGL